MRSSVGLVAPLALVGMSLTGCGGSAVDASCPVDELTHEVEHMVAESYLTVDSVDELKCSGDWATVTATLSGDAAGARSDTLLFRKGGGIWVLKSPELVCDPAADEEAITGDLAADVCGTG